MMVIAVYKVRATPLFGRLKVHSGTLLLNKHSGTLLGHGVKFWDCPGHSGTVGNYAIKARHPKWLRLLYEYIGVPEQVVGWFPKVWDCGCGSKPFIIILCIHTSMYYMYVTNGTVQCYV